METKRTRKRFNRNAVCRVDGNSEIYKISKKSHLDLLSEGKEERTKLTKDIIDESSEITSAKDLIGRFTVLFNTKVLITVENANKLWEAFGKNIKLV